VEIPDRQPIIFAEIALSKISYLSIEEVDEAATKLHPLLACSWISIAPVKMTLFILTETSAGYALLKAKDKKLLKRDNLVAETETAEGICSL
jgi:hypothetical protein